MSRPGSVGRWTRGISTWDWMACLGLVFYSFSSREATVDFIQLPNTGFCQLKYISLSCLVSGCRAPRGPVGICWHLWVPHRPWGIPNGSRSLCLGKGIPLICHSHFLPPRRKNGPKKFGTSWLFYFDQDQSTQLWCQFSHCKVQVSCTLSHYTCSLWRSCVNTNAWRVLLFKAKASLR